MIQTPIIWNITSKCPYSCSFCCINANNSKKELNLEEKMKIIENIDSGSVKIDLSGGELFIDLENMEIIKELSKKFGKKKISVTSTGKGLENIDLGELSSYISELGFSYDFPREPSPIRPEGYNRNNLKLAKRVTEKGIHTIAQTILMKQNVAPELIKEIYINLSSAKIEKILLMRFSESGKGIFRKDLVLDQKEINKAIKYYNQLEKKYKGPKIKINPQIKGRLFGMILTSLNINPQGLLLSNPWSYKSNGNPKEIYILGDLKKEKLSNLAGKNIYKRFFTQLRRNIKNEN